MHVLQQPKLVVRNIHYQRLCHVKIMGESAVENVSSVDDKCALNLGAS